MHFYWLRITVHSDFHIHRNDSQRSISVVAAESYLSGNTHYANRTDHIFPRSVIHNHN